MPSRAVYTALAAATSDTGCRTVLIPSVVEPVMVAPDVVVTSARRDCRDHRTGSPETGSPIVPAAACVSSGVCRAPNSRCFSIPDRSGHLFGHARRHPRRGARLVAPVGAGRHPDQLGETSAEGAQRRAAHRETDLGDAEVATAQQRHRALDAPRHQVPIRRLAVGGPELPAEVPGRHVRAAGERLDVQWLRVLPVDPVADTAQPGEVAQVLRRGGPAGHLCNLIHSAHCDPLTRARSEGLEPRPRPCSPGGLRFDVHERLAIAGAVFVGPARAAIARRGTRHRIVIRTGLVTPRGGGRLQAGQQPWPAGVQYLPPPLPAHREADSAAASRINPTAWRTPPSHAGPWPGNSQVASMSSTRSSDSTACSGLRVNGAGLGPVTPVRTLRVVIVSPINSASRAGTCTATLPGVCPGVWMIRGEPGTSSTSLSATVSSSVAGRIRSPPRRAEYHRKPARGPILTGPQPELGFLTVRRARSTSASWMCAAMPVSRYSRAAKPMWSVSPWVRMSARTSPRLLPVAASSA